MNNKFKYIIPDNLSAYQICGKSNLVTAEGKKQRVIRFESIDPISLKPKTSLCAFNINATTQRHKDLCYGIFENIVLRISDDYFPDFICIKSLYYYVSHAIK
jgi:hypothetical protein